MKITHSEFQNKWMPRIDAILNVDTQQLIQDIHDNFDKLYETYDEFLSNISMVADAEFIAYYLLYFYMQQINDESFLTKDKIAMHCATTAKSILSNLDDIDADSITACLCVLQHYQQTAEDQEILKNINESDIISTKDKLHIFAITDTSGQYLKDLLDQNLTVLKNEVIDNPDESEELLESVICAPNITTLRILIQYGIDVNYQSEGNSIFYCFNMSMPNYYWIPEEVMIECVKHMNDEFINNYDNIQVIYDTVLKAISYEYNNLLECLMQKSPKILTYIQKNISHCLAKIIEHNAYDTLTFLGEYWDKDAVLHNISEYHQCSNCSDEMKNIITDYYTAVPFDNVLA